MEEIYLDGFSGTFWFRISRYQNKCKLSSTFLIINEAKWSFWEPQGKELIETVVIHFGKIKVSTLNNFVIYFCKKKTTCLSSQKKTFWKSTHFLIRIEITSLFVLSSSYMLTMMSVDRYQVSFVINFLI